MNEQREQQQRSPMSHCPMLYYHYLFSCFRFHSISLTAISISSNWPNKIRSRGLIPSPGSNRRRPGDGRGQQHSYASQRSGDNYDLEQLQIMKVVLKSNLDATCSCKNKMVTVTRWPFSGFLHFPDHQGFICLWCDRQWPSVGRWLQWNWNITGQNLPTLIGAISWNFIFQFKSLSNARPPNGLLDIKVSTPCLYISIQGGLMMRGVVQRCPQPPMRFYR